MKFPAMAAKSRNASCLSRSTERNSHYVWFLFWPCYILRYFLIERWVPARGYTLIWCTLDDRIPFREEFLLFYVLWYVLIVGMHLYTAKYDTEAFHCYSQYLLISMTISTCIFLLFPSCQNLRPTHFPRENLMTDLVKVIYSVDTNTNVFPSEHVIGAVAVLTAALHTERLRTPRRIGLIGLLTVLAGLSTVFLKQHSVMDVLAALPVCMTAEWIVYGRKKERNHV